MMQVDGGHLDCIQTQGFGPMQPVLPVWWWDPIVVEAASWKLSSEYFQEKNSLTLSIRRR